MSNEKPQSLAVSLGALDEAALAQAKRWNLVCDNGQIICLRQGCGMEATLPSLLCAEHLAMHRRGQR
jgi:hypothetical protein